MLLINNKIEKSNSSSHCTQLFLEVYQFFFLGGGGGGAWLFLQTALHLSHHLDSNLIDVLFCYFKNMQVTQLKARQ